MRLLFHWRYIPWRTGSDATQIILFIVRNKKREFSYLRRKMHREEWLTYVCTLFISPNHKRGYVVKGSPAGATWEHVECKLASVLSLPDCGEGAHMWSQVAPVGLLYPLWLAYTGNLHASLHSSFHKAQLCGKGKSRRGDLRTRVIQNNTSTLTLGCGETAHTCDLKSLLWDSSTLLRLSMAYAENLVIYGRVNTVPQYSIIVAVLHRSTED